MQATHFWNKFYLHRAKVILCVGMMVALQHHTLAQRIKHRVKQNNPNYDDRKLSYGFLIGIHSTSYQIKYSKDFASPKFDSVTAVLPSWSPGFSLGAIINYRIADFFDLRTTPKFAFYENRLKYTYSNRPSQEQLVETVMVELPILLKYKSERRGNVRMYMIGGFKPGIEASGKKQITNSTSRGLEVKGTNLSAEMGFGFDLYYPLFKFSPELRFSRGLVNVLDRTNDPFAQPINRINTNTVTLYLLFQ
ncbi:MAG TPA: porin family protein [Cyclobacteriaceae bacterium]|nr:porin family protein [Cyclobacteriaceae bacterium]